MSTQVIHWMRGEIVAKWGFAGDCARIETADGDIHIHAHGTQRVERLKRAIEAFAREMQREPIETREAAE